MKNLMAANWKMFKTWIDGEQTAVELVKLVKESGLQGREVLVCPPAFMLKAVGDAFKGQEGFYLGAQNFYPAEQGAFTGEIAPEQLLDLGCSFALAGHSERRQIMGESDEFIGEKVAFGLQKGLKIVLCIGETIEQRQAGQVEQVLTEQLEKGLSGVDKNISAAQLAVAYEPVWAIGTGEVAGPEEIAAAHTFIRKKLMELLAEGEQVRILYGGSVKPGNCAEIINLDNVNGVLVGGASLKADSFSQIISA